MCLSCFGVRRNNSAHFVGAEDSVRDRIRHAASLVKVEAAHAIVNAKQNTRAAKDGRYQGGITGMFRNNDPWSPPRAVDAKRQGMLGRAEDTARDVDWWTGAARKGEAYNHHGGFANHNDWWDHVQDHHAAHDHMLQGAWSGHDYHDSGSEWSDVEVEAMQAPQGGSGVGRRPGPWDADSDEDISVQNASVLTQATAAQARRHPKHDGSASKQAAASNAASVAASSLGGTSTAPMPTRKERPRAPTGTASTGQLAPRDMRKSEKLERRTKPAKSKKASKVSTEAARPVRAERAQESPAALPPPDPWADSGDEGDGERTLPLPQPLPPPPPPPKFVAGPASITAKVTASKVATPKTPKPEYDPWADSDGSGTETDPGKVRKARPQGQAIRGVRPSKPEKPIAGARRPRQSSRRTSGLAL
mmetsp:Transcript_63849/g.125712  ORF Transcript_63849/g.125712 Transcript_63849/m.125712 type:complete len:418 (-) Transcript_63849:41-1294(-)